MSDQKYEGPFCLVRLHSGHSAWVRGEAEDLAHQAGDVAGATFLALEDLHGETFFVRARDVALIAPAKLLPLAELVAQARGPASERLS